LAEGEET